MTIRPGEEWGRFVERPAGLRTVHSDRELATVLDDPTPVALRGGDLYMTLGARPALCGDRVLALPVDVLEVSIDGGPTTAAVAHVVLRSPWWRGGPLRGPLVMVMNAEFLGRWDVAPRGHPNDGRAEVLSCEASFGVRDRLAARRRLPSGTHLPHPGIATRSVRRADWAFRRAVEVVADGARLGRGRSVEVAVRPDAAVVHV